MGPSIQTAPGDRVSEEARRYFEPRLTEIGLSAEKVAEYSLPELHRALERVNDAIAHPESFGVLKMRLGTGRIFVVSSEAEIEIGILPLLLDRKRLILTRIAMLTDEEKVGDLRSLAQKADPAVRDEMQRKLNELEAENQKWREESLAAENTQRATQLALQLELTRADADAYERRWRIRHQTFLERQSVATIIGAILLIAMFVFIAVSVHVKTPIPELISNAFLVILGYFFGHAGTTENRRAHKVGGDSSGE